MDMDMEESIGLGFSLHHGAITGATEFVTASVADRNGCNFGDNVDRGRGGEPFPDADATPKNGTFVNNGVPAKEGGLSRQGPHAHVTHGQQQQQQNEQLRAQPPSTPSIRHPTANPQTLNYSQAPSFLHPPPALPASSHRIPPHIRIQSPSLAPKVDSGITAHHLPPFPFQPPPGLPPAAVPHFLPPPPNVAPHVPMPPSSAMSVPSITTSALPAPPPSAAPLFFPTPPSELLMQSQVTRQHSQQHEVEHEHRRQQEQSDCIEKARAIAMRFHQESTQKVISVIDDISIKTNVDYAQQRQAHFQNERRKLQSFRLKNLEYVMKHEEGELRRHVECMNQMTAYEERQQVQLQMQRQQQRQQQLQLEQKRQQKEQSGILNGVGGGIGSREQIRAEQTRKKQWSNGSGCALEGTNNSDCTSLDHKKLRTSLYLTNLPVDGSTTERTLQSLFCMYGRLDRVTMYRHRSTGKLKGDGLIVFGRDALKEHQVKNSCSDAADLIEAVCTQMNGAELPCGTAIGVQPADMDYKKKTGKWGGIEQNAPNPKLPEHSVKSVAEGGVKQASKADVNLATTSGCSEDLTKKGSNNEGTKDDEDLDDFFASLE